jgi:hypothetical protein
MIHHLGGDYFADRQARFAKLGEDYWRKGCDIFGRPNDPDHPWNKEKSGRSEKLGST